MIHSKGAEPALPLPHPNTPCKKQKRLKKKSYYNGASFVPKLLLLRLPSHSYIHIHTNMNAATVRVKKKRQVAPYDVEPGAVSPVDMTRADKAEPLVTWGDGCMGFLGACSISFCSSLSFHLKHRSMLLNQSNV